MSEAVTQRPGGLGRRAIMFLAAGMAAAAMYFAITASAAQAVQFCTRAYLQPYGHNGDRCWGTGRTTLGAAAIYTYERAGCVDIANGSNELMFSWVCAAAGSYPEYGAIIYDVWHEGVFRKGVIRNNNLSYAAYFSGSDW